MIHRESGVLCDATSLALNVFDILKGGRCYTKGGMGKDESLDGDYRRCGI